MLDSRIPEGPLAEKWSKHKGNIRLVTPANKRLIDVIVVGTGLAGSSAAASLAASLSQFAVGEGKFEYYEDFGSEILDAEPPALPHQDSVEYEYSYYEMSESLLCE